MKTLISTLIGLIMVAGLRTAPGGAQANPSFAVRMTLADGSVRTVSLDGVGCSEALCSRVVVRTWGAGELRTRRVQLDSLAAIRHITSDAALFVFKDGTARREIVSADNRFWYLATQNGGEAKIDLRTIASLEFVGTSERR